MKNMKKKMIILLLVISLFPQSTLALPQFMEIYNKDKFAKKSKKNKCSVCHINPSGGGPRNAFGKAFDKNGNKINDDLRNQFPKLFDLLASTTPKIKRIKPRAFIVGVEKTAKILGKNFLKDDIIKVDDVDISEIPEIMSNFISPKRVDLTITFDEPGKHTIQVENVLGQSSKAFKVKVKAPKVKK